MSLAGPIICLEDDSFSVLNVTHLYNKYARKHWRHIEAEVDFLEDDWNNNDISRYGIAEYFMV